MDMKEEDVAAQLAHALAAQGTSVSHTWAVSSAPQAHTSMLTSSADPLHLSAPPPAHAHTATTNQKPPDTYLVDKTLLEAAASYLDTTVKNLATSNAHTPVSGGDAAATSIPWALQQQLLQQYGHLMLEKMIAKQSEGGGAVPATATTDIEVQPQSLISTNTTTSTSVKAETSEPTSIEAQRDVYRRMLNFSMSNPLAQQYYLSQYGYNYIQDRSLFAKSDSGQGSSTTATLGTQSSVSVGNGSQLPSIDSVLLNLSTKKQNGKQVSATTATAGNVASSHVYVPITNSVPAYGLQTLANAAIEADPKAFHEADHDRKDVHHKTELEDVTDTDSSNLSPSDGNTSQIMSPPRNTYSHLMETSPHLSIPAAHSHQLQGLYQSKSGIGTLPSIHHFSTVGKPAAAKIQETPSMQLPLSGGIKPSDLVAAAMKLKMEVTEEKEIADRTIQEKIAAHQLQQQVSDLTASALAAGNLDAAALLAKLQASNLENELHRLYDAETLQALQHEPMDIPADLSPTSASRRKSRGRPTSIESLRDPLGRQTSTMSNISATSTVLSGESESDRTYDCEICGKQFSHNDRLRRHRKIHTTDKPYKCDICGKGFKEKCNLKHHRFIHTGEKPYKCDTCGKSFNQRSSLKTHQKVHTGEKPFKCELCEKPFAQKYLLRQHMKKHIELNMATSSTPNPAQQRLAGGNLPDDGGNLP
ncbi:zinc finger and BTB domain-containing protein 38-like isoform X2 [Mya arenaria]|uniref:zinc finger and BTB domain-containing protein 38-like isoform X2 n=1 Tax=Mya arenaria TaxID=6604 RepID=UPI0022E37A85|nr:zinc finger and BTB domain-containing protein 38-like isoform X2 [Mya arenaria]